MEIKATETLSVDQLLFNSLINFAIDKGNKQAFEDISSGRVSVVGADVSHEKKIRNKEIPTDKGVLQKINELINSENFEGAFDYLEAVYFVGQIPKTVYKKYHNYIESCRINNWRIEF